MMGIDLPVSLSNKLRPVCNHWILIGIQVGSETSRFYACLPFAHIKDSRGGTAYCTLHTIGSHG